MFHPKSLHQRTVVFILVPIFLLLTLAGIFGYHAVRKILLEQWGETALANLGRAAHQIDMRLNHPKQILFLLEGLSQKDSNGDVRRFIIEQLNDIEGVINVKVDWSEKMMRRGNWTIHRKMAGMGNRYGREEIVSITEPTYNSEHNSKTFSLVSHVVNDKGDKIGTIEIMMDYESLISQAVKTHWWSIYKAYIIDFDGHVLTGTMNSKNTVSEQSARLFGATDILEQKTLAAMKTKESGTVFGPGRPPEEISGFFRLQGAPWSLIVIAPGAKVLQPILQFRIVYFLTASVGIGIILLFIRLMITQTTRAIKQVSQTATNLAQGVFGDPLVVTSQDEVGELTRNFNTMTSQLKKGLQLQKAMDIAREVQLTLLPREDYCSEGLGVSGLSVYCDETGGDYFDFIESDIHPGRFCTVVGDVVGHGVGAALLMATLRASVRASLDLSDAPHQLIKAVNRQLCKDTSGQGNFASLFFLRVDIAAKELQWVRAGHDPGILYNLATEEFTELKGKGLVLGIDRDYSYQTDTLVLTDEKYVLLIYSDGAWEVENEQGEQFGKYRLMESISVNCLLSPADILNHIIESINTFRGTAPLNDDITLVALSIDSASYESSAQG